jgi:hypothetical protein
MLDIGVDWVALSFDQRPEDILLIQRLILAQPWPNTFPPEDNGQDRKAELVRRQLPVPVEACAATLSMVCSS